MEVEWEALSEVTRVDRDWSIRTSLWYCLCSFSTSAWTWRSLSQEGRVVRREREEEREEERERKRERERERD